MDNPKYNQALFEHIHGNISGTSERTMSRLTWVANHVPTGIQTVLDLGAGRCYLSNLLLDQGFKVISFELVLKSLKNSQALKVQGNGTALPFRNDSVDLVICVEVIEHLLSEQRLAILQESWRVARDYVLIAVPNNEDLNEALVCCDKCGLIFHPWGHLVSFNTQSMHTLLPIPPAKISIFPLWEPRYFPPLLAIRQKVFRTYSYDSLLICPGCFHSNIQPPHRSFPVKVLDRLNYWLGLKKESGWLLALYDKRVPF